jgi:hypothetical protein
MIAPPDTVLGTGLGIKACAGDAEDANGMAGTGCFVTEEVDAAVEAETEAGRAGDALSLTIVLSTLISGVDKPSIIDLPIAPSITATLHTV